MTERDIFVAVLQKETPAERQALLDVACAGRPGLREAVEGLLRLYASAGRFLERPALAPAAFGTVVAAATTAASPASAGPGMCLGPFKLIEPIGEGGMGTVFLAQQTEPVKRRVALKVIKPGLDSRQFVARFEAERQALALMDHPNIARVLDAGTTPDGRPYFVMELIKGVPITRYCDEHQLTPRQRLELFLPVCQAVQHAHQKGVIHRDLKPSNVLVARYDDRPVPKVIDFGVAKAAGQPLTEKTLVTGFGAVIGTLEYMSPEQAQLNQLDIDTRSDIYSLGVLLYELLTGTTPLKRQRLKGTPILEVLRLIRDEEPPRPSARLGTTATLPGVAADRGFEPKKLSRLVRGELDWIVLKALEKDRGRRYETASALAQDVQNYLLDQPVRACPASFRYRLAKLVRRHRGLVLAGALVLLLLLGGIAGTTAGLVQAEEARRAAEQERDDKERARREALANLRVARQVVDRMLTRVADERLLFAPHMVEVRRDLLREALAVYQGLLAGNRADPELRLETALAFARLGRVYDRFGQHAEAEQNFGRAVAELERLSAAGRLTPEGREELVRSYIALGWTFGELGRHDERERVRRQALALAEQLADEHPGSDRYRQRLAGACIEVGNAWRSQRPAEAAALLRRAIALMAQKGGSRHYGARAHMSLGELLVERGDLHAAVEAFGRARDLLDQVVRTAPDLWQTRDRLGEVNLLLGRALLAQGRPAEAESAYRRALEVFEKTREGFSALPYYRDQVALANVELVLLLTLAGRADQARATYRQLVPLQPESPGARSRLAWLLAMCAEPGFRDPQRAVELARGATRLSPRRALSWRSLGAACYRAGDARGAAAALTRSMELSRGGDGFDWFLMGLASARLSEKDQARRWYDDAVGWTERHRPDDPELRRIRAEAAESLGKEKAASPGAGAPCRAPPRPVSLSENEAAGEYG